MSSKKTPEQRINELQLQLARAKDNARRKRAHRLIIAGSIFEPVLNELEGLDKETRHKLASHIVDAVRKVADKRLLQNQEQ